MLLKGITGRGGLATFYIWQHLKLNTFNNTLKSIPDIHAPMKSIKISGRPCCLVNQEIKDLVKSRGSLLK